MPTLLPNMTPEEKLLASMMERGVLEKLGEKNWTPFLHFMDLHTPCIDLLGSMEATLKASTSEWAGDNEVNDGVKPLCRELGMIQDRLNEIVDVMADVMGMT